MCSLTDSQTTSPYTVGGLTETTGYTFFVYAGDASGFDTASVLINATTLLTGTVAGEVTRGRSKRHS